VAIVHAATKRKANGKGIFFGKSVPERKYTSILVNILQQISSILPARGQSGHRPWLPLATPSVQTRRSS